MRLNKGKLYKRISKEKRRWWTRDFLFFTEEAFQKEVAERRWGRLRRYTANVTIPEGEIVMLVSQERKRFSSSIGWRTVYKFLWQDKVVYGIGQTQAVTLYENFDKAIKTKEEIEKEIEEGLKKKKEEEEETAFSAPF